MTVSSSMEYLQGVRIPLKRYDTSFEFELGEKRRATVILYNFVNKP